MVTPPNILLIISDDVGVDQSACYDRPSVTRAAQPNIEALCARGVTFTHAWSSPTSSPTRAGILTGRYAHNNGVGEPTGGLSPGIPLSEYTIPEALDDADSGYAHAAIGKWHLSDKTNGGVRNPNLMGFSHFDGAMGGLLDDYREWHKVDDGTSSTETTYATSDNVDNALAWIEDQDQPWFLWLAFNAGHTPFHLPPSGMYTDTSLSGTTADISDNPSDYYRAMLEAMDAEIGRLLDDMPAGTLDNTVIIYVGDNGTEGEVNEGAFPSTRAKGTLYEGGVHVPLIVAGPGITSPGRRVGAMVNTVDIFSTVLDLAGVDITSVVPTGTTIDAVSMVTYLEGVHAPRLRKWQLSEASGPRSDISADGGQVISDGHYKLLRMTLGGEQLYERRSDPHDLTNLLDGTLSTAAAAHYHTLSALLDSMPLPTDSDTGVSDTGATVAPGPPP